MSEETGSLAAKVATTLAAGEWLIGLVDEFELEFLRGSLAPGDPLGAVFVTHTPEAA